MKKHYLKTKAALVAFPISAMSIAVSQATYGQQYSEDALAPPIEEVRILGRMKSSATDVVMERMELEVAVDILGAEQIGRIGDSTVAAALRRMPGVTLVDDKFVYVRGLGERYSSTRLNGAYVPSPDLSRSVIPLDIIPTSIVNSLAIQKAYSADMPAAFGGGSVDIRTKGIPDAFELTVEIGTGMNSNSDSDAISYAGGGDDNWGKDDGTRALDSDLENALFHYRGNLSANNIRDIDKVSLEDAETINRNLMTKLNRDQTLSRGNPDQDLSFSLNTGNVWAFDSGVEIGFLVGGAYDRETRNSTIITRNSGIPDQAFTVQDNTVFNVSLTGNLSLGLRLNEDNVINTTSLYLRNTDDEASITDILDTNRTLSGGAGFREYATRYEQREMTVNQIRGEHRLTEETRDLLHLSFLDFLDGLEFHWFYSDSSSTTDIPGETTITADTLVNTTSGEVQSETFASFNSTADFRYTNLEDDVDSYGWDIALPADIGDFALKFSGGTEYWQKARNYRQLQFYIDTSATPEAYRVGSTSEVFSNAAVTAADRAMKIRSAGDNENSYIAASKTYAGFTKFDLNWNDTWRLALGMRWEDYQQVNLPWNPLEFVGNQLLPIGYDDPDAVADYFNEATFKDWNNFGSAAVTYSTQDFWAEDFQLRFSFGETTVRPDLRDISPASYRDPITELLVFGNPDVTPSYIDNFDARAEWFFSNGDNFTLSLFTKDITDPIEAFEVAASDDTIALEIINAESGSVSGVEIEFLKSLADLADFLDPFFVQGNMTFMDSEIVAGSNADAPTNETRPMQGASDNSGNLVFGFDSPDSKHAATLSVNYFSERLYFAGRLGREDSYEQPFTSLDLTYSFYPTDNFTVKFKAKNLLDENVEITKVGSEAIIFEKNKGQTFGLDLQYKF